MYFQMEIEVLSIYNMKKYLKYVRLKKKKILGRNLGVAQSCPVLLPVLPLL